MRILTVALAVLMLTAQSIAAAPNWAALDMSPYEPPKPAPSFALPDLDGKVTGKAYGVFGPPTAYLIDRQGRLLSRMVGSRSWGTPAAKKLILDLLAQRTK